MSNTLEHLKAKPEKVRKRVAVITTIVLTGIIVLVWLTILYSRSLQTDGIVESPGTSSPGNIFLNEISEKWYTGVANLKES